MPDVNARDLPAEFSSAIAAYLNSMAAIADCLEQTYPDVGGPYRQRLHRLRSRVAFDATQDALKDSVTTLESELKDYAGLANRVLTQRAIDSKRGMLTLSDMIENLAERQELFGNHLLYAAEQMEDMPWPSDPDSFSETKARHAAALRDLVDSMGREATSILSRLREQMIELDQRLAGAASTDPVTGLINRREMERQIQAHKLHGSTFALLLFEIQLKGPEDGPINDQVLRTAAARLLTKFRHTDWIGRWGAAEFAVLFLGEAEIAQTRAAQAVTALQGRYVLDNGEPVLASAKGRLVQAEFATAK